MYLKEVFTSGRALNKKGKKRKKEKRKKERGERTEEIKNDRRKKKMYLVHGGNFVVLLAHTFHINCDLSSHFQQ
jgi:hypothetical protein